MSGYDRVSQALGRLERRGDQEAAPSRGQMLTAPIGRDHDLDEVLLGIDREGLIHLLARLPEDHEPKCSTVGGPLRSQWRERQLPDGTVLTMLDITCLDKRITPTLISLIGEMLDRMERSERAAVDELRQVLSSWRRALTRTQAREHGEILRGLFGELVVAEQLAQKDPGAVTRLWKGPFGGRHDFTGGHALEVKTYTSGGLPMVTISGLDQLQPPYGGSLHLLALRIVESEDGRTIDDLAESLLHLGVEQDFLEAALSELGCQLQGNAATSFRVEQQRLHAVGDDFPGLRRSRFQEEDLKGVDRVVFTLDLDAAPAPLDIELLDEVLERLVR